MSARDSLGVARWGATERIDVPAASTRSVSQFIDFALDVPQAVEISFYAVSTLPLAGLSVRFELRIGLGSTNHSEIFTMPVQDELAQTPIVLRRPAQRIQIEATAINVLPDDRRIEITALTAPVFTDCGRLR